MESVLDTRTPEGIQVVLPAIVWAKVLTEHAEVADLDLIDRVVRDPHAREPDPLPRRERLYRRERGAWALVVISYAPEPAVIVTAFTPHHPPA